MWRIATVNRVGPFFCSTAIKHNTTKLFLPSATVNTFNSQYQSNNFNTNTNNICLFGNDNKFGDSKQTQKNLIINNPLPHNKISPNLNYNGKSTTNLVLYRPVSYNTNPYTFTKTNSMPMLQITKYSTSSSSSTPSTPTVPTESRLTRIINKVKHEIKHYWVGTKLLYFETKTCFRLLRKLAAGGSLSRREQRQMRRTTADLLRLVPFSLFLIIPFMEFLLPVALKLFPGMLPSTYEDKGKKEEDRKRNLKVKIEVAKFLQDAATIVHESALSKISKKAETDAERLRHLLQKIEADDRRLTRDDVLEFAKLLEEDFTLDNLERDQLVNMCKFLGIASYGTNSFLRYRIDQKTREIKNDDKLIAKEGLDELSLAELQSACRARGMKGNSRSKIYLKSLMEQWLHLSLEEKLPISLLILSNAFKITEAMKVKDALRETLYHLPDNLVDEIKLKLMDDKTKGEIKLEVLQQEAASIQKDEAEAERTSAAVKLEEFKHWVDEQKDIAQGSINFSAEQLHEVAEAVANLAKDTSLQEEREDLEQLRELLILRREEVAEKVAQIKEQERLQKEELERQRQQELEELQSRKQTVILEEELAAIKQEEKELKEQQAREEKERADRALLEEKEEKRVNSMELKLEKLLDDLEKEANEIEASNKKSAAYEIDSDGDGFVSTTELSNLVTMLNKHLPTEAVTEVVEKLDIDRDGKIPVEQLIKAAGDHPEMEEIIIAELKEQKIEKELAAEKRKQEEEEQQQQAKEQQ